MYHLWFDDDYMSVFVSALVTIITLGLGLMPSVGFLPPLHINTTGSVVALWTEVKHLQKLCAHSCHHCW